MNPVDCPFRSADAALNEMPKDVPVFVDFHAEATSEKITLAHYLDGRVTAVVGMHTHVQTSDAMVLPGGTAFLSDLGMTGPWYSSIGRQFKPVLQKFLTGVPARFDVADGPATLVEDADGGWRLTWDDPYTTGGVFTAAAHIGDWKESGVPMPTPIPMV